MNGAMFFFTPPRFTFVLCLAASMPALGLASTGLPTGLCSSQYYQCDAEAETRWSQFRSSDGIDIENDGLITIGECSRNGQSNDGVYVLMALSSLRDRVFFNAKIGFHTDFSDHRQLPATRIDAIFPDIHDSSNQLSLTQSHAYIDYTNGAPFRYWLRYNSVNSKYLMVIYFGFVDTLLCEFQSA